MKFDFVLSTWLIYSIISNKRHWNIFIVKL